MPKLIPAAERLIRARALIQQARDVSVPAGAGRADFSYIAQVKDLLRQARDLIKFIPQSASATEQMKAEVRRIYQEADQADHDILHGPLDARQG